MGTSKFIIVINKCHTCLWFDKKKKKKQTNYFSFNVCGKGNTVPINAQTSASSCVIPSFHAWSKNPYKYAEPDPAYIHDGEF